MTGNNLISFRNVSKSYDSLEVLSGLNFSGGAGEKISLIGPSGSGKTTILRILMALESLTSGHIVVDGKQLWHEEKNGILVPASEKHLHELRAKIGMVFQHFNLFPHMNVLKNVTDPQRISKNIDSRDARDTAVELLETVGLGDKLEHYPSQLSEGQQRVAIARALALKPKIMLFSEPDVCDAEAFAVKAGNPKGLNNYSDIASAGAVVGVCGGCAEEGYALDAGVDRANVVVFPDGTSGISMLQNGRIDAVALSGLVVIDLVEKAKDSGLEIVYPVGDAPQSCAGAAFRPADRDFRDAYDVALAKIKADGSFKTIIDTYGFATWTALGKTRADYCPGS